jgi:hypothetical protein
MAGRPINKSRELALISGDKTYTGAVHSRCGTSERYMGGGCVHCARLAATEGREARKLLKAQQAGHVPVIGQVDDEFTKSLDDLM